MQIARINSWFSASRLPVVPPRSPLICLISTRSGTSGKPSSVWFSSHRPSLLPLSLRVTNQSLLLLQVTTLIIGAFQPSTPTHPIQLKHIQTSSNLLEYMCGILCRFCFCPERRKGFQHPYWQFGNSYSVSNSPKEDWPSCRVWRYQHPPGGPPGLCCRSFWRVSDAHFPGEV